MNGAGVGADDGSTADHLIPNIPSGAWHRRGYEGLTIPGGVLWMTDCTGMNPQISPHTAEYNG